MNINQKAQELAKLIKTTDEFQTMNKYKREIEKNKNIKENSTNKYKLKNTKQIKQIKLQIKNTQK